MQIKRNISTKLILLIIPTIVILLCIFVYFKLYFDMMGSFFQYTDENMTPTGLHAMQKSIYIYNFKVLACYAIGYLFLIPIVALVLCEPIYNKNYTNFVADINLESLSKYKGNENTNEKKVSKFIYHFPKIFLPLEETSQYMTKTRNCMANVTENGLKIKIAHIPFGDNEDQYNYEIPFDDIIKVEKQKKLLIFFSHNLLKITLKNESKFIIMYNNGAIYEMNSLIKKLEVTV